jgi:glycopeptide antibiotics resistance protein
MANGVLSVIFYYEIFVFPLYVIGRVTFLAVKRIRERMELKWPKEILMALFAAYLIAIISQTVIPVWALGINNEVIVSLPGITQTYNFIPFRSIIDYFTIAYSPYQTFVEGLEINMVNFVGNLLMLTPLGFFVPSLWKKKRNMLAVLWIGAMCSATIETIQFFIGRTSDIDDIILNSVGVTMGYLLYWSATHFLTFMSVRENS